MTEPSAPRPSVSFRALALPLVLVLAVGAGRGQGQAGAGSPAPDHLLGAFTWRNLGPANMGGRIVDIEAVEGDWRHVFLAHASGGVFESENAGTTWKPIFADQPVSSIGDIAVFQPDPDILWVGTGEANNRNSVSWGNGVYRSTDGGDTWQHLGLGTTHQIARVVVHPTDSDVAYVAAIGHLWGYSGERGLFRTTDGGATWQKLGGGLPDDGRTGATELVMHPRDPEVLYTAFYHRLRRPWMFHSGGPNGGIFKSTDGGNTWHELTEGLPPGDTGRIGLAIHRADPRILMAIVEAAPSDDLAEPGSGLYRSEDGGATWTYVNTYNNRPFYYSQVRIDPVDDQRVYVLTTRFMVSRDGGRTLRNGSPDQEVHGDFHAMWIHPEGGGRYYLGADKGPFLTHDGEHFLMFDNVPLGQYYRIAVDMRDPYHVYGGLQDNGTWGGPSFSRDVRGILADSNWKLHWGDGMHIAIDPTDWRRVYTESENGRFRRYDPVTHRFGGSRPRGSALVDPGGLLSGEGEGEGRRPRIRFNWTAPLVMSPHDPATLYLAGNHVFRTTDRGDTWEVLSPDLSTADPDKYDPGQTSLTPDRTGAETHCTVTTLSPSPVDPDVIWTGTDDGNVHVTRDGGACWNAVRDTVPRVPAGLWVSRIEASHFDPAVAYLAFDGHRSDEFSPWLFRTGDHGGSWQELGGGLPDGHVVRVVREDPRNPDLLFAGTEFGLFASLDRGTSWHRFMNGLPTVPVYDLVVHPRDGDLIAGTHGRSIWIADDITPLQQLDGEVLSARAHLFDQRPATLWENVSRGGQRGHHWFAGENPDTIEPTSSLPRARFRSLARISYWIDPPADADGTLEIATLDGTRRRILDLPAGRGIHRLLWDRRFDPEPLTGDEVAVVEELLEEWSRERDDTERWQGALERFRAATSDRERLEALGRLRRSRTLRRRLDRDLRGSGADAGTYRLVLHLDGEPAATGTLEIRPDPLLGHHGR